MVILSQPQLGQDIRKRRLELGWTQTKLAEKMGTNQTHINQIELGAVNPKCHTIQRIYDALGVKFVVKDAQYDINARLEMLGQTAVDGVHKIMKKLGIR